MKLLPLLILTLFLVGCGMSQYEEIEGLEEVEEAAEGPKTITKTITKTVNITKNITTLKTLDNISVTFMAFSGIPVLIELPDEQVLINGASNADALHLTKFLQARNFSGRYYLIATNGLDSNVGGLDSIATNFNDTRAIYDTGFDPDSGQYSGYILAAKYLAHGLTNLTEDKEIDVDEDATFTIFAPYSEEYSDETAENTMVPKLQYYKASFLILSDCGVECQVSMLNKDVRADILHTNVLVMPSLLSKIKPKVIISDVPQDSTALAYTSDDLPLTITTDGTKYIISD